MYRIYIMSIIFLKINDIVIWVTALMPNNKFHWVPECHVCVTLIFSVFAFMRVINAKVFDWNRVVNLFYKNCCINLDRCIYSMTATLKCQYLFHISHHYCDIKYLSILSAAQRLKSSEYVTRLGEQIHTFPYGILPGKESLSI